MLIPSLLYAIWLTNENSLLLDSRGNLYFLEHLFVPSELELQGLNIVCVGGREHP